MSIGLFLILIVCAYLGAEGYVRPSLCALLFVLCVMKAALS